MTSGIFSYTKVKGITIGDVTNFFYDKHNDTVVIVEDQGGRIGIIRNTFGSRAEGLVELIDALENYHQKKYLEKEEMFVKIRKAIAGVS